MKCEYHKKIKLLIFSSSTFFFFTEMLYIAPELLRSPVPQMGTIKADVYSFAIILEEISVRGGPYEMASVTLSTKGKKNFIIL